MTGRLAGTEETIFTESIKIKEKFMNNKAAEVPFINLPELFSITKTGFCFYPMNKNFLLMRGGELVDGGLKHLFNISNQQITIWVVFVLQK